MGLTKRLLEQNDNLRCTALELLLEVGAIEECEIHNGIYFEGGGDVADAYKLANARISQGEIELPDGVSRRDFTDIIQSVYHDNYGPDGCYAWQKNADD